MPTAHDSVAEPLGRATAQDDSQEGGDDMEKASSKFLVHDEVNDGVVASGRDGEEADSAPHDLDASGLPQRLVEGPDDVEEVSRQLRHRVEGCNDDDHFYHLWERRRGMR